MDSQSIPRTETVKALPKCCAGCGSTEKSLMAPHANARNYSGPFYCMSCNPRFAATAALRSLVTR
jgi:ribosomal protein S27AE